ncbi:MULTISPECIES: HutD family protein [unclassified Caballeronia]|uniref:HutD/Ves family protein n=1 Tax=unclassified Caballeronia TaxID=2646786 RepID=UPI0028635F51|nr:MULTISPECIES: HutD family protein [unclassified Caballeronia]MDR5739774.1 HutD family protein [Caballeronia sp. LZ016]MDR5808239.1 HutD family protein [Caballeronia sp. LZ019]
MPWKNGGGVTREIAASPPGASLDAFAWRLSVADVSADGAFSAFPGVDRVLVLLGGAGMRLTETDGRVHALDRPLAIARFAGETPIHAALLAGPTRDFNVMVRRDRARASVDVRRGAVCETTARHDVTFIHCVSGGLTLREHGVTLDAGDTLRIDRTASCVEAAPDSAWLHIGIDLL